MTTSGDHLRAKRIGLGPSQHDVDTVHNWKNNRNEPSLHFIARSIDFLVYALASVLLDRFGDTIAFYRKVIGFARKELDRRLDIELSTIAKREQKIINILHHYLI